MLRLVVACALLIAPTLHAGIVVGSITDADTQASLPGATIRVLGTGRAMLANDQGQYRLRLEPGDYQLKFSHVAHYSEIREVTITGSEVVLDVEMRSAMIEIPGTKVYSRAYDAAQRIIVEAIARKKEILSRLQSYDFDAYTKLLVLDTSKADSESVVIITETQLKGFWEQPDKYKEVVTARRVTANIDPENVLVTIGEILNFNADRIDFDEYLVVSPTATDALDHYNYYLLDTLFIDEKAVFRLEIEPKNDTDPLFAGTIDIADSSFEVVGVDCRFNEGFETPYMDSLRYRQRYAQFENEYWMPVEIGFEVYIDLPIPGFPIYSVDYVAALHNYSFEVEHESGTFDYVLEVDPGADDVDSATWYAGQLVPLTELEQRGYERIDSLENTPRPLGKKMVSGLLGLVARSLFDEDFFHFNRVEGAYLGQAGRSRYDIPRTTFTYKTGYAFDRQRWQLRYGLSYRLWQRRMLDVGVLYSDDIISTPTLISPNYNPTIMAMIDKTDPHDYYRVRGAELWMRGKIRPRLAFEIGYLDHRQYAEVNHTDFGLLHKSKEHRLNPAIVEGTMRIGRMQLTYDSRPVVRLKNDEFTFSDVPMTVITARVELASPDLIDNDFDFVRYSLELRRRQRTLGMGLTTIRAVVAASDRSLPPQRYFTLDFGDECFSTSLSLKTLGETNFKGSRAAYAYATHDFGKWLFRRSGLPLIKDLPFSLILHGGAFWTDFDNHTPQPGDDLVRIAPRMYSEIGFGLGSIPPLMLTVWFTWQLSDYDTNDFSVSIGSSL